MSRFSNPETPGRLASPTGSIMWSRLEWDAGYYWMSFCDWVKSRRYNPEQPLAEWWRWCPLWSPDRAAERRARSRHSRPDLIRVIPPVQQTDFVRMDVW
jgi:hypothetical protein